MSCNDFGDFLSFSLGAPRLFSLQGPRLTLYGGPHLLNKMCPSVRHAQIMK